MHEINEREVVERCLAEFDFDRAEKLLRVLELPYAPIGALPRYPTADELRKTARKLLVDAVNFAERHTGEYQIMAGYMRATVEWHSEDGEPQDVCFLVELDMTAPRSAAVGFTLTMLNRGSVKLAADKATATD